MHFYIEEAQTFQKGATSNPFESTSKIQVITQDNNGKYYKIKGFSYHKSPKTHSTFYLLLNMSYVHI